MCLYLSSLREPVSGGVGMYIILVFCEMSVFLISAAERRESADNLISIVFIVLID